MPIACFFSAWSSSSLSQLFSLVFSLIIFKRLKVIKVLNTYKLSFIALITINVPLWQRILLLIVVGLRGLLDLDSKSRRRIFSYLILFIVIILLILHYKLVLLIVYSLLGIETNYML
jgi:hypothetical protein